MMHWVVKTFGSLGLLDVVAGGACADTAIARVMISARTGNERSRLGDMADLHALTRDLLAPLNSSPRVLSTWETKRLTLSRNRLGEAGKAASDGRVQKLYSSRQAMYFTLCSAFPQCQVKTDPVILYHPKKAVELNIGMS
jgi:hypothetical protein